MGSCPGPFRSTDAVPQPDEVVSAVAAYNAAISRVVEGEGAVLVDLHADAMKARDEGVDEALVGPDGFHPSTRGHARVAEAFSIALRSGGTGVIGRPLEQVYGLVSIEISAVNRWDDHVGCNSRFQTNTSSRPSCGTD